MKILIINYEYPPLGGGGGVATKQLAEELAKSHHVHVLTTWYPGLEHEEIDEGVHVHRVRVWGRTELPTATIRSMVTFVPAAFVRGWKLCKRTGFDIINAQFVVPSGIPAVLLAKVFRLPFVLSFIGGDLYDPSKGVSPHRHPLLRATVRAVARGAQICTAISEDTKRRAQDLHGVACEIVVTHLGLVPRAAPAGRRLELGLPENVPLFVSVGRLIPRKRYDVLIKAWQEIPAAHLLIIGDGPLREELVEGVAAAGLSDRVHLPGFVSEDRKRKLLSVADGYVSATAHEGFGIVFLEAMEVGLPIVSTGTGGHRDFLAEGQNALLVPVGDASALAAGVQRLLQNPGLRIRMGQNNKERVKDFYLEKTARRFEQVLFKAAIQNAKFKTQNFSSKL